MTYVPKYQGFIDDQGLGGSVIGVNKLQRRQAKARALMPRSIIKPSLTSRLLSPTNIQSFINQVIFYSLPVAAGGFVLAAAIKKNKKLLLGSAVALPLWFLLQYFGVLKKKATLTVARVF